MNIIKVAKSIKYSIRLHTFLVALILLVNWIFGKDEIGFTFLIFLYTALILISIASYLLYSMIFIDLKDKHRGVDLIAITYLLLLISFSLHISLTLFSNIILGTILVGLENSYDSRNMYHWFMVLLLMLFPIISSYYKFLIINYEFDNTININDATDSKLYHLLLKVSKPFMYLHLLGSTKQRRIRNITILSIVFVLLVVLSILNGKASVLI